MTNHQGGSRDVLWLSKCLPNLKGLNMIPFKQFNHLDFLWAKNANLYVYDPMLKIMKTLH
ncbi:unnamed protein product [Cyprideis torosa]|uniref:Uncharacterized protein n=1 Tax=Cyprideis torosa TaxID=163714 RepID=A0A7R8WB55_9CRUS|nr:unnamed protein product [Cyprideis torosa]CAG0891913.1 unnamed protein product [Cyprideis torosa]